MDPPQLKGLHADVHCHRLGQPAGGADLGGVASQVCHQHLGPVGGKAQCAGAADADADADAGSGDADATAAWTMSQISPSPTLVALVQAAASLP